LFLETLPILEIRLQNGWSIIHQKSKMNNLLLPVNDEFIDTVAKAIARNRIHQDASSELKDIIGFGLEDSDRLETTFDNIFERLWGGTTQHDENQKDQYRADARAAIAAINLKLLTSVE